MMDEMTKMRNALQKLGVNAITLKKAHDMVVRGYSAPILGKDTLQKIYCIISKDNKVVITLSRKGTYKVFTIDGYLQMKRNGDNRAIQMKGSIAI